MINLINERCELNPLLDAYPTANLTLCVLGTQGSGKSTLLNCLFQSKFPTLQASMQRTRCTSGVWLQHINNFNVLDTEGFDSLERSEDEKIFQKQMSLLCVVLSDVILINLYMDEIGRYAGSHMDILEAVFKVGERLVTPHQKKIIYIIRDCTEDADHKILSSQLTQEIKSLSSQHRNKQFKYSVQFFFFSHYVYQPELFLEECQKLVPKINIRRPSAINNYLEQDRVQYLHSLWNQIRDSKTELDLKSIDDAIKNYVIERIKHQTNQLLLLKLQSLTTLQQVKSYDRLHQLLQREVQDYLTERQPLHMKQKERDRHVRNIYEQFEPIATKHFNSIVLNNVEEELQQVLEKEIAKNQKSKKLSSLIFKKKKEMTDIYKKFIENHKEYSLLLKYFQEKMSEIIGRQENRLSHLFSLFEMTAENQLNKLLNQQTQQLTFNPQEINDSIKKLLKEHQYNEWEIDFSQIWENVSYRCLQKIVPQVIVQKSVSSVASSGLFGGDQTTSIIATHTTLEKKALNYGRDLLCFLNEENTLTQPLTHIKDIVRQCLSQRLIQEQRKWKISLLLISFLLFLLYGELQTLVGYTSFRKKTKRTYLRFYYWTTLGLFLFALSKQFISARKRTSD